MGDDIPQEIQLPWRTFQQGFSQRARKLAPVDRNHCRARPSQGSGTRLLGPHRAAHDFPLHEVLNPQLHVDTLYLQRSPCPYIVPHDADFAPEHVSSPPLTPTQAFFLVSSAQSRVSDCATLSAQSRLDTQQGDKGEAQDARTPRLVV